MAQQSFAGFALLIALGFAIMALVSCASSEHVAAIPVDIASVEEAPATPEFHGARIGTDGFRSRVPSED